MSSKKKKPTVAQAPSGGKQARAIEPRSSATQRPVWAFRRLDIGGPWCWTNMPPEDLSRVLKHLGEFESMTWQAIESGTGSHFQDAANISKKARDRLIQIEQDDVQGLFSLSLMNKWRMWGFREGEVLAFLWWDPDHEVFPSKKKHT